MEGTSCPVYDNLEDVHDCVSKTHHFSLQRAMNDVNSILHERIDNLVVDFRVGMHESEALTKD